MPGEWFEAKWPMSGQRGPGRDSDNGVASCCMGCNRGCHRQERGSRQGFGQLHGNDLVQPPLSSIQAHLAASDMWKATDIVQRLGLNASDLCFMAAR